MKFYELLGQPLFLFLCYNIIMIYIPKKILQIIENQQYSQNNVGLSGSTVLVFSEYVLKIQKKSFESNNEREVSKWLNTNFPIPEIIEYVEENNMVYTLMTKIKGNMLCDEKYMNNPDLLLEIISESIQMLWKVDIHNCPISASLLENRLKQARYNVEHNLVNINDVEPDTFGPNAFKDPFELLSWLENNKPQQDIVLTHGDFCLPNVFAMENHFSGFIDIGKMGPADRWQDIAIVLRSLKHNAEGYFTDGKPYFTFSPPMLLQKLGIPFDEEKNRYYKLLDELF